jgi:hypothetical protein
MGPPRGAGGAPFDLEKVRKNWDRALEPSPSAAPPKLARTRAPSDPFVAAREGMTRLRSLLRSEHPSHEATLAPFVDRVEQLLARMEAAASSSEGADDPAKLREEFHFALGDLQDLLEVFSFIQR